MRMGFGLSISSQRRVIVPATPPAIVSFIFNDATASLSVEVDTVDATALDYVVSDNVDVPSSDQVAAGLGADGIAASIAGTIALTAGEGSGTIDISGLPDGTWYIYGVARIGADNLSAVASAEFAKVTFTEIHPDPNFSGLASYVSTAWVIGSGVADISGTSASNSQIELLGSGSRLDVTESTQYRLLVNVSDVGVPATANRLELIMQWYNVGGTLISSSTSPISTITATGEVSFTATSPAGAVKFNHRIRTKDADSDMTLDRISFGVV